METLEPMGQATRGLTFKRLTFFPDHVRHPGCLDDVHGLPDHPEVLLADCHHPLRGGTLHVSLNYFALFQASFS